jgi:phage terminase large subunit-like protein
MIPKDCIIETKSKRNIPDAVETIRIRHSSGGISTIIFKSYDQGREIFQGNEYDGIFFDEEAPLDCYSEALIRTMTTGGFTVLTFTPLKGVTELVMTFLENSQETDAKFPKYVQTITWWDVPHLDSKDIEEMLAATPPQLRDARSKGIPTVGTGLVYPVDTSTLIVDDFPIPKHFKRLYGMDVGWNSTGALWGAWDLDNDVIYITSEHKQGMAEPIVHAAAIKSRGEWIKGQIDPASRGRSQVDGQKLYEIYRDLGLKIYPANNAVEAGIFAVWERMTTGRLKVFKSCSQFLRELSLYHRDDNGKIVKKNDHLCLSGDTQILTDSGYKQITNCLDKKTRLVTYSGALVETNGAFEVKESSRMVKVVTRKGELKCTEDHLLLATSGLWYDASISEGIQITHLGEKLCQYWSSQKQNKNLGAKSIGSVGNIFSVTENDYILLYGNIISDTCRKAMLSTTLMAVDITTRSKTLPALLDQNISRSTIENVLSEGLSLGFQKPLERLLPNGTNQIKAQNGIKSIMKTLSICFTNALSENAPYAVLYTKLIKSVQKILSVQQTADLHLDEEKVETIFNAFVQFVTVNLLPTNILLAKHVQMLADMSLKSEAVISVHPIDNEKVYCFDVEGFESFVVGGGIVVHNCDCLKYLINAEPHAWGYPTSETKQKVVDNGRYINACT